MFHFYKSSLESYNNIKKLIFSFEDKSLRRAASIFRKEITKGALLYITFKMFGYLLFGYLTLDIYLHYVELDNYLNTWIYIALISFILGSIRSYALNKYLNFNISVLHYKILPMFINNFKAVLSNDKKYISEHLHSAIFNFYRSVNSVLTDVSDFIYTISILIIVMSFKSAKTDILYFVILALLVIILIGGRLYKIGHERLSQSLQNQEPIKYKDLNYRVWAPFIYNFSSNIFMPLILLFALKNNMTTIIPVLVFLPNSFNFLWSFITNVSDINVSNKVIKDAYELFCDMENKFIINNKTYQIQCKNINLNLAQNIREDYEKGLYLDNFIPMSITNGDFPTHSYTGYFRPGIYQIVGANGIGKTTFFKALALPKGYRTEFSRGSVLFNGISIFDPNMTLLQHRNQFYYIGHRSEYSLEEKIDIDIIKDKYPHLWEVVHIIKEGSHDILSEGEQAIVSLVNFYLKVDLESKILLIDEVFSRIYGGKDIPIRDEAIRMLQDISNNNKSLIIFIVDHSIDVPGAENIQFTRKGLDL